MSLMERPLTPTETARRFGVSIKALRLYEQHGLLAPLRSRAGSTGSAWRSYGPDQIARLHQILALKCLGFPLARIGALLKGPDTLKSVLALQEQVLARDCARLGRALGLVHAARSKLASGQVLSIDDLANLTKETSMASKLTRQTYFHPALVPHQHKYFRPEEIDALASREGFDQEREIAVFFGMVEELKDLAAAADPASPAALDLGRRWKAHGDAIASGGQDVAARMRNMVMDALADPATAPQMPFSAEHMVFLVKIMGKLKEADVRGLLPAGPSPLLPE
jgi:MerR family transcriptional regulator, thiopeptide resistance regulator